jgi:coatomer protein complex subunit gamma
VLKPNWSALWEEIGVENEFEDNYTLSIPTLEGYFFYLFSFCFIIFVCFLECVKKIISYMGTQPYEQLDKVAEGKASHTLYLTGIYRGEHDVLVRAKMALEETSADPSTTTITMQLTIRSTDRSAVQVIASAIAYINKQ